MCLSTLVHTWVSLRGSGDSYPNNEEHSQQLDVDLKFDSPLKGRGSLDPQLTPLLGQGRHEKNLEQLAVPESNSVLRG